MEESGGMSELCPSSEIAGGKDDSVYRSEERAAEKHVHIAARIVGQLLCKDKGDLAVNGKEEESGSAGIVDDVLSEDEM